jgi:glutamate formiminotransferase/formiminotetrahydrofolate cyclodeaminase
MQDCVAIARRLGQRVGEQLEIPVFLYEQAATQPERRNLENIRRGQYEALKEEIGKAPERAPDFGPARLGPAGATVIGARPFLIAYNIYLTTDDISIAERIAKAIRHSSGGLRYVKALGLLVDGRAQVSMNLTDFHKTPVARVVELIRQEARRYGVSIHHSELVGLIPEAALVDAAVWYLQLDQFEPEQVLESKLYRLAQADVGETSPASSLVDGPFLGALAGATPTPGGGSAAAYAGAMAAALVEMVAKLTVGKKKYAEVEAEMQIVLERASHLRAELTTAVAQDAAAFEEVMSAFRMAKDTPEQAEARSAAIEAATLEAAREPLRVAHLAVDVLRLAAQAVAHGNRNTICDAGSGAALAEAALAGASLNVQVNLATLKDREIAGQLIEELRQLESTARELTKEIENTLASRGGLSAG